MVSAMNDSRPHRLLRALVALLLTAGALVGVSVLTAPPAIAAPDLICSGTTVYATNQGLGDGDLWEVDASTGVATEVVDLPGDNVLNQLGISPGGGTFFFTKAGEVYEYSLASETYVSTPAEIMPGFTTLGGAVNPLNGLFYYGGFGGDGTQYRIAAYDPATDTNLGIAATIQLPAGISLANSDFAFDILGRLYIVGSAGGIGNTGYVVRVNGDIPATASNVARSSSVLTTVPPVAGVTYAAIAFSGTGELFVGGGTGVLRLNATTGAVLSQNPVTGPAFVNLSDYATCDSPPTLTVQKSVAGRAQSTDQFALAITGDGIVPGPGTTGVTDGTETGLQIQSPSEVAGAVIVQPAATYDFAETASGTTDLVAYTSRWECVDSEGDQVGAGDGASGSVTIPAIAGIAVICTIFNEPLVPALTLDKRITDIVDVNDNGYNDVGDQILWEFELANTGETTLSDLAVDDDVLAAAGIGITCDPDALAIGGWVVCTADAPYTITAADLAEGQVVNSATATGTPPGHPPVATPPDTTETPVGGYAVVKTAGPASGTAVPTGAVITYTVTVTQQGQAAVLDATFEDDLADVLDSADFNDDAVASSGTVSFDEAAGSLAWTGDLAVGDVVTVTYSVTVTSAGDGELRNTVSSPGCADACTTEHLRGDYTVVKASDPESGSSVQVGEVVAYTLTVTQVGPGAVTGATVDDDLSAVLDDATYNADASATSGSVVFDAASGSLRWDGDLPVGGVVAVTYSVTVTGEGDTTLTNVATSPGCDSECTTEHSVGLYTVVKSSDPEAGSVVGAGEVIEYTIVVSQQGSGSVAAAELSDDLSGVLDDAVFNDDLEASAGTAALTGDVLRWEGALGVGDTVEITYTVTVTGDGDGTLPNAVTSPGCADACSTEHLFGAYSVVKSADPESGASVAAGDVVTYTVTVSQQGPGAVDGAAFEDELGDVLDDADYNDDAVASAGAVSFDDATGSLAWTGTLAVGDVVTVTYSVTVTGAGDGTLANAVTSPGCAVATDCATEHLVGDYAVVKTSDPAPGSSVQVGDVVTYTLTVTQEGPGAVTGATLDDDLSAVLDDAAYNADASTTAGTVAFDPATATVRWDGDLPVGAAVTITYSVTVTGAGDTTLTNIVESPGCETACTTEHFVGLYSVTKTADPAPGTAVGVGDTIAYTIVVAQRGAGAVDDAGLTDDLSAVLDDATFNDDLDATAGIAILQGGTLDWSGSLQVGDTVEITYSVTVTGAGDGVLTNVVTSPGCATDCSTEHLYGGYTVVKTAYPASGSSVAVGDVVTYTVTVTQEGPGAVAGAMLADDLSDVLDDADYNGDAEATSGTPVFDGDIEALSWTGDLAPGAAVTLTYSVTVTGEGDGTLANAVTGPGCAVATDCATEHLVGAYAVVKTSDPAPGSTVAEGQVIDYTITVTQSGPGTVTGASLTDDLSAVLDDARYNGDLSVEQGTASVDGATLTWTSDLAPGAVVTITYSVTVGEIGSGDGDLQNAVTSPGCEEQASCTTQHRIGSYVFSKTSDPGSGSEVATADRVTYTVTVTHQGIGPVSGATVDDDLSDVLDDATFDGAATATAGSVARDGDMLHWTGDLAPGDVVTITYSVTVTAGGDGKLVNVVSTRDPAGSCDPDAVCATTHRVPPPAGLAVTGGGLAVGGLVAAGLLLAIGAAMAFRGRRRERVHV